MNIEQKYTPHQSSRKGWIPDMICCHQTSGSIRSCINWFTNPESKVSAHFAVAKDGTVYQFVPIEKMAWCNGTKTDPSASNYYGRSPNPLIRSRKTNANLYTVSIEFENNDTGILTELQYKAGLNLIQHIRNNVKKQFGVTIDADRLHIIGHCDCSPVNKAGCPGKDFPFDRLIEDLNDVAMLDRTALAKIQSKPIKHPATLDDEPKSFFKKIIDRFKYNSLQ